MNLPAPPRRARRHSAPHSGGVGCARPVAVPPLSPQALLARRRSPPPPLAAPLGPASLLLLGALVGMMMLLLFQASAVRACTTIAVGRLASVDGSVMVTHNNDCEDCDVRIGVVPAASHPSSKQSNASCAIYPCGFDFPRYIGRDRGELYTREHLALEKLPEYDPAETKPLGSIPQVPRTHRYFDGSYAMMNEHQLAIGESTCGAKIAAYSVARGGEALMEASVLTRLALERCKTARCAVLLMGSLAERYGFMGSEDPVEEGQALFDVAGEALTVIDTREAWVMHLLADSTGRSAIWAAQRVPDDHVAVVPNQFVIDRINVSDSANFLASRDIVGAAVAAGLADAELAKQEGGEDNFHFSRAFALDYDESFRGADGGEGERRRWRVFSLLAPSLQLAPDQGRFPFSVPVDPERKVSARDVMALMRDHYEGTVYDATQGLAAGPFGNPLRYDRSKHLPEARQGFFERSISLHRTSYSFVAQAKAGNEQSSKDDGGESKPAGINGGTLWFAHHSPANSLYMPLPCSASSLPASFGRGTLYKLSRESAWWAFASVANNADRMYQPIHAYIAQRQQRLEQHSEEQLQLVQDKAAQLVKAGRAEEAQKVLTQFAVEHNQKLVDQWWELLDELMYTFRDGVMLKSAHPPLSQRHIFYPLSWLKQVGYFEKGPLTMPRYPAVPAPLHTGTAAAAASAPTPAGSAAQEIPAAREHSSASADSMMKQNDFTAFGAGATPVRRLARRDRSARSTRTVTTSALVEQAEPVATEEDETGEEDSALEQDGDSSSTGSGLQQPQQQQQQQRRKNSKSADDEDEHDRSSTWDFLRSAKVRTPIAIALFSISLLLVACVCFQVGRMCTRRREGYEPLGSEEMTAAQAEAARMGYGSREGFSRSGPRVVLTTR